MTGRYQMVTASGEQFEIDVPTFSLDQPEREAGVELIRCDAGRADDEDDPCDWCLSFSAQSSLISTSRLALVGADIADRTIQRYTVLIAGKKGRCTGVVLAQNIVLTAAHCIVPDETYRVGGNVSPDDRVPPALLCRRR